MKALLSAMILATLLVSAPALSQEARQPTRALTKDETANYDAALVLFHAGDYAGALVKFQAAFDTSHDARLLWNMAACAKNLRRYVAAIRMLEQYVDSSAIADDDKRQARALVKTMSGFVTEVVIDTAEKDATVAVDGAAIGKTPLPEHIYVDLGEHAIRVDAAGFAPFETKIVGAGGDRAVVTVKLERRARRGTLSIVTDSDAIIRVDQRVVGSGHWEGAVDEGPHHVELTGQGKRPYVADVAIHDKESRTIEAHLDAVAKRSSSTWLWVTGGVVVAGGLAVGGYFLFRPRDQVAPPLCDRATIPPYCITVGR
jgi:PEGA domain-containing protein